MTRPLVTAALTLGGLALAAPVAAAPILWISDDNANLFTVDVGSGAMTMIGRSGAVLTDIAFDASGQLWGVSFDRLFRVDRTTAALTEVGRLGFSGNALTFGPDGRLFAMGEDDGRLYTLDTAGGAATAIGTLGDTSSGDLAFVGDRLFAVYDTGFADTLARVELGSPATGIAVGSMGINNMFGLAGVEGVLYGVSGRRIYTIDQSSGIATQVQIYDYAGRRYGAQGMTALPAAPVPEPAGWAMMIAGFGLAGLAMRRRISRATA